MRKSNFIMAPEVHHDKPVLSLSFEEDYGLVSKVKTIGGTTRSQTFICPFMHYNNVRYQKITTAYPKIKILYDTSTKPEPPAPGLKYGHDIAPIAANTQSIALQPPGVAEHKVKSIRKNKKTIKK